MGNIAAWEAFVDGLNGATDKLKSDLKSFVRKSLKDSNDFLKRQAKKIVIYAEQFAQKKITKTEFEKNVRDIKLLAEVHAAMASMRLKKKLSDFAILVGTLILKSLIAAL